MAYKKIATINNLKEFQKKFNVSDADMKNAGAHGWTEDNDYDTNVIKKILRKKGKGYKVKYVDEGDQYNDYWIIYRKQ